MQTRSGSQINLPNQDQKCTEDGRAAEKNHGLKMSL